MLLTRLRFPVIADLVPRPLVSTAMVSLGHVHLPVSDLARSRVFYTETMGLEIGYEDEAMIYFPSVGLIIDQARDETHIGPGTILGLNCDDADSEYENLRRRGALLEETPQDRPWGVRNFYLSDPDGHQIEFEQSLDT